jgi:thiamine kinase-like enzyme
LIKAIMLKNHLLIIYFMRHSNYSSNHGKFKNLWEEMSAQMCINQYTEVWHFSLRNNFQRTYYSWMLVCHFSSKLFNLILENVCSHMYTKSSNTNTLWRTVNFVNVHLLRQAKQFESVALKELIRLRITFCGFNLLWG